MSTRILFPFLSLAFCLCLPLASANPKDSRPNVLFLLSDDQAWGDYGFMGHEHIQTPVLDQLAKQSLTYTRGYTPVPLCRPSLASLATGLHAHQHGVTGNDPMGPRNTRHAANQPVVEHYRQHPDMITSLTKAGYKTLQTGKWWEGNPVTDGGFTDGMTHANPNKGGRHGDAGLTIGREGIAPIIDFVKDAGDQPWFIWYGVFLPHTPHNAPKELLDKYLKVAPTPAVARYWANCEWLDLSIGMILDFLKEQGQLDNTLIVYTCDNGWVQNPEHANSFAPRSKLTVHEGGIRTPIMISLKGKVAPSFDHEHLASNLDIWPTIAKLTRTGIPGGLPGIDLTNRKAVSERDTLHGAGFHHDIIDFGNPSASLINRFTIHNHWKLIMPNHSDPQAELYDLKSDPWETTNLAAENPDVLKKLGQAMDAWWTPTTISNLKSARGHH